MKNLSFIILLFLSAQTSAQVNLKLGAGYSFKSPVYSLFAGYKSGQINFNGGFTRSLNRDPKTFIQAGGEIGYGNNLVISAGIWHVSQNSDQKAIRDAWRPSVSLRYSKMISENGGLFGQVLYLHNDFSVTVGMLVEFN